METDSRKRQQASLDQLNALVEFLKEHQELATGLTRGRRSTLLTVKLWNLCAKKLNVFEEGAHRDGRGWSRYWCDWKYRVRRKALQLKAAQESNRPLPDGFTALSPIEESIIGIIGEHSLNSVVIKCDPAGEQDTLDEANNEEHNNVSSLPHFSEPRCIISRKRRHSSKDVSDLIDLEGQDSPSTPPYQRPRVDEANAEYSDDDNAAQFLQLEREKLDTSNDIRESLKTITSELTRLTDVMSHIKDVLVNRINI